MKKISILGKPFMALLVMALVFGLALAGCKSEPSENPEMTAIYVVTRADLDAGNHANYTNTIAANERYMLRWFFNSPNEDVEKFGRTIKRGAELIETEELVLNNVIPKPVAYSTFSGTYTLPAGSYTIEVYIVDVQGRKSNTKTVPLTVTP